MSKLLHIGLMTTTCRFDLPDFRAINQAWVSPLKHSSGNKSTAEAPMVSTDPLKLVPSGLPTSVSSRLPAAPSMSREAKRKRKRETVQKILLTDAETPKHSTVQVQALSLLTQGEREMAIAKKPRTRRNDRQKRGKRKSGSTPANRHASPGTETLQTPRRKESKKAETREQPIRQVKSVPTIEYSDAKTCAEAGRPLEDCSTEGSSSNPTAKIHPSKSPSFGSPDSTKEKEQDHTWSPSQSDLEDMDSDVPSADSPSRSPRKRSSTGSLTGRYSSKKPKSDLSSSSYTEENSPLTPKSEPFEPLGHPCRQQESYKQRSPSPSICNANIRRQKLEEHSLVEQPKAEHLHQEYRRIKILYLAERRKLKGKGRQGSPDDERNDPGHCRSKRKLEEETGGNAMQFSKKQKIDESMTENAEACGALDPHPGSQLRESDLALHGHRGIEAALDKSLQTNTLRQKAVAKSKEEPQAEVAAHRPFDQMAHDGSEGSNWITDTTSALASQTARGPQGVEPASIVTGKSAAQRTEGNNFNERWKRSFERREVAAPEPRGKCTCAMLPEYFTPRRNAVPSLASWPGGHLEFFEHVKQISSCRGHPKHVVNGCQEILRRGDYQNWNDGQALGPALDFADKFLSSTSASAGSSTSRGRAQSSIAPQTFYGHQLNFRQLPGHCSPPRSAPTTSETISSKNDSLALLPMSANILGKLTPPNSLPLGTKEKGNVDPPNHEAGEIPGETSSSSTTKTCRTTSIASSPLGTKQQQPETGDLSASDDPFSDNEGQSLEEGSKACEDPQDRPLTRSHVDIQRKRHQSLPADLARKKSAASNERVSSSYVQTPQVRALQALSFDAGLPGSVRKEIVHLVKETVDKHLPRLGGTPADQANIPTTRTIASNRAAKQPSRKRGKKSTRERQKRYPKLSRDVPLAERKPDEAIIEIGKIINPYGRHKQAPYVFSWHGRLYAEYLYLLEYPNADSPPAWNLKQISRMRR